MRFIKRNQYFKDRNVYFTSCDKDFYQIINDRIKVWSPSKKKLYGPFEIHQEYGISTENFINYRILEGDSSDSINGIPGAGLKTILKCFPFLSVICNIKSAFEFGSCIPVVL